MEFRTWTNSNALETDGDIHFFCFRQYSSLFGQIFPKNLNIVCLK